MNGFSALKSYRNVSAQSAVVDSNPHQLILMLLDGAIERTAGAIGHMRHGEPAEKGRLIGGSMAIIDSLRASLNHAAGGALAGNLDRLYDYMNRRLLEANMKNDTGILSEVVTLLKEIREAWNAIPQTYRGASGATVRPMFTSPGSNR
jgi:flagellar protein FliS